MSVVALSIIIPTALILISLIVSRQVNSKCLCSGMWGPYGLQIIDTLQVYLCICQKRSGVFIAPLTFTNHHLHMAEPPCPPAICSWCCWGCGCQCSSGSPPSSGWLCARMALGLWRVNTSEDNDDWHAYKKNYTQIDDDDGSGCDDITSIHRSGRAAQTSPSPPDLTTRFWQCTDYY